MYLKRGYPYFNSCSSPDSGLHEVWDFGDGSPLSTMPVHTYPDTGCYTVTLTLIGQQCGDTATTSETICVEEQIPCLMSLTEDTFSVCPPHLSVFSIPCYDTLTIKNALWDFGDGSSSTLFNPAHIYNVAGDCFAVTLYLEFLDGAKDTLHQGCINVGGATGNITFTPDTACAPVNVCLDANSQGAVGHYWIFGFNQPIMGDDTICLDFINPGVYYPSVVLTDSQIPEPCAYILYAENPIVILAADTTFSDFTYTDPACTSDSVLFVDASYSISGGSIRWWNWDFGDSSSSAMRNPEHVYDNPGTYDIELHAKIYDNCHSIPATKQLVVNEPPAPLITQNGNVLATTAADSYQWYRDGALIAGADSQSLTVTQDGVYFVAVTDSNGCEGISDTLNEVVTGINIPGNHLLKMYPNPFSSVITLELPVGTEGLFDLFLFDMMGRKMLHVPDVHTRIITLERDNLLQGVFYIEVRGVKNTFRGVVSAM